MVGVCLVFKGLGSCLQLQSSGSILRFQQRCMGAQFLHIIPRIWWYHYFKFFIYLLSLVSETGSHVEQAYRPDWLQLSSILLSQQAKCWDYRQCSFILPMSKTIHDFLTVTLICISLIANNVDHLFYIYLVPVAGQTAKQVPEHGWLTHKTVVYKGWRVNSFESWEAPAQGIGRHESTLPRFLLWFCLAGADEGCLRPLSLMKALLLWPNTS